MGDGEPKFTNPADVQAEIDGYRDNPGGRRVDGGKDGQDEPELVAQSQRVVNRDTRKNARKPRDLSIFDVPAEDAEFVDVDTQSDVDKARAVLEGEVAEEVQSESLLQKLFRRVRGRNGEEAKVEVAGPKNLNEVMDEVRKGMPEGLKEVLDGGVDGVDIMDINEEAQRQLDEMLGEVTEGMDAKGAVLINELANKVMGRLSKREGVDTLSVGKPEWKQMTDVLRMDPEDPGFGDAMRLAREKLAEEKSKFGDRPNPTLGMLENAMKIKEKRGMSGEDADYYFAGKLRKDDKLTMKMIDERMSKVDARVVKKAIGAGAKIEDLNNARQVLDVWAEEVSSDEVANAGIDKIRGDLDRKQEFLEEEGGPFVEADDGAGMVETVVKMAMADGRLKEFFKDKPEQVREFASKAREMAVGMLKGEKTKNVLIAVIVVVGIALALAALLAVSMMSAGGGR